MSSPIPAVYRVAFTYIDPAFCLLGATMHLFTPEQTLKGYSPLALLPAAIETTALLDSISGFFLMLGVIEAVLLRLRSRDATVWRVVQAGALWVDVCMVWATYKQLTAEGWLADWTGWSGDDWRNGAANAGMGCLRLACAMGIGMSAGAKAKSV